ncbi:DUF5305 domain-containing protein [Haloplanus sp.]|uniref:DUF5305 domain-containing protein n=1 Tax=Haloplanus sp. TaxID=1961696 RepID=UPI0026237DF5|nr:DUF5305 domain-containing protein [Haloplanus sp.]
MSREWGVRGRILLGRWFAAVLLLAVVVATLGGYATYTAYESPGTTTEQRQVSSWEATGTYDVSARVSEPNPLYPVDTQLDDQPAYFLSISPVARGTFGFGYQATNGGDVDVTIQQTLVLRSVDTQQTENGEMTVEYWRLTEPLGTERAAGVSSGESVERSFERNISATADRMSTVSAQLGGTPGTTEMLIVSTVEFQGTVNGKEVDRTTTYRLPIEVGSTTYRPGSVAGENPDGSTTELVTRQRTYGPLYRIGGPVALLIGLVGVGALAYGRYDGRFAVSEAERAALEFESTREEFDDWITTARLPEAIRARPRVEVESLDGLVDTAIDVDARVFETPERDAFYVADDGLLYAYEPPTAGLDGMLGGDADSDTETDPDADGNGGDDAADGGRSPEINLDPDAGPDVDTDDDS